MKRFENLLLRLGDKVTLMAIAIWMLAFAGIFAGAWRLRGVWIFYVFVTVVLIALVRHWAQSVRQNHIREAPQPHFLQRKLRETYPHLSPRDCELVERGLRQFFIACLRSNTQFVAMPSKAVDALWHEFILHTQAYKLWCRDALGFFLHHTPAEALGKKARHNDGLRRAWYWACKDEAIHPRLPSRLPLLFALDTKLAIPDGFHYAPGPQGIAKPDGHHRPAGTPYFGTDFSDSNFTGNFLDFGGAEPARRKTSGSDGGDSGFGDDGDSGDGGSDGGGD